jgi:chromosome segregation ATPase
MLDTKANTQSDKREIEVLLQYQFENLAELEDNITRLVGRLSRITVNLPSAETAIKDGRGSCTDIGNDLESNNSRLREAISRIRYLNENLGI